jgi:hypothetical protein
LASPAPDQHRQEDGPSSPEGPLLFANGTTCEPPSYDPGSAVNSAFLGAPGGVVASDHDSLFAVYDPSSTVNGTSARTPFAAKQLICAPVGEMVPIMHDPLS